MSEEAKARVSKRITSVDRECKESPGHDWAGEYVRSFGLGGDRIWIAPKSGAANQFWGCLGLYDEDLGAVTEKDGRITIQWDYPPDDRSGPATTFLVVRWGQRRYLIEEGRVLEFCDACHKKREPTDDRSTLQLFYRRAEGEKMAVTGNPILPKAYQHYWTLDPIRASILSLGSATTRPHRTYPEKYQEVRRLVRLSAGVNQHVLPQMDFRLDGRDDISCIRILRVREKDCDAEIIYDQPVGKSVAPPKVGSNVVSCGAL